MLLQAVERCVAKDAAEFGNANPRHTPLNVWGFRGGQSVGAARAG